MKNPDIKLNGLKMTYIGQASLEGPGTGGTARVKTMIGLFKEVGIELDLISYSFYSDKFKIEHKKIDQLLHTTTIHIPNSLPKFLKVFAIFPGFFYAWKSCRNCDLIFADFIAVVTSLPAIVLRKISNKPLILDYIDVSSGNVIDILHNFKYTKNTDVVFAISHYLYEIAKSDYGCKNIVYVPIFIINCCINLSSGQKRFPLFELTLALKFKPQNLILEPRYFQI